MGREVRAVLGIRGEPSTPADPARGLVWRSIVDCLDQSGTQTDFVTVTDVPRATFARHAWSIGGGGAAELKAMLEFAAEASLGSAIDSIGITSFTLEDEVYILPGDAARRRRISQHNLRAMVVGDSIRDWDLHPSDPAILPYDESFAPLNEDRTQPVFKHLSLYRTCLAKNRMFGSKTKVEAGLKWYEYGRLTHSKLRIPLSIAFAFVATHNHFVLDRGGKVFNRSAPVIKLPRDATDDDHLALLGLLNSSTACFWMKQVFFPKGGDHVGTEGARVRRTWWDERYEFAGTQLQSFPVTQEKPLDLATHLDRLAQERQQHLPAQLATHFPLSQAALDEHRATAETLLHRMIAL